MVKYKFVKLVPKNFLVTRLQNIGDVLVFIPAIRALRQAFPDAKITFLGKHAGGIEIIKDCPYIDDIIIVKNRSLNEKFRLINEFRKRKIDYFIISPQDLGRVPWAILGGAKKIAGFPSILNHGKINREKFVAKLDIAPKYDPSRTEIENCLRLVHDVIDDITPPFLKGDTGGFQNTPPLLKGDTGGFQNTPPFLKGDTGGFQNTPPLLKGDTGGFPPNSNELEFWYTNNDLHSANNLLEKYGVNANDLFIVSAPYSKREAKNWPEDRFVKLFNKIINHFNAKIILIGGKAEKIKIEKLASKIGDYCITLSGDTSLGESAAIIENAFLFFGPDSGPAFIATAMKTPAVVMYSAADYYRWRVPESSTRRIEIFHPFPCNPCKHQICPEKIKCINSISVDEAWNKIIKVT